MKTPNLNTLTQPLGVLLLLNTVMLASSAQALKFTPASDQAAPRQAAGGASRETVRFVPVPGQEAPQETTGGASRGEFNFIPAPGQEQPSQGSGGASRGEFNFIPASDQSAPSQADGGASRGEFNFIPAPGQEQPSQGSGGASRGEFNFVPASDSERPEISSSGSSRGDTPDELADGSGNSAGEMAFIPPPERGTPTQGASGATRRLDLPPAVYLSPDVARSNDYGDHHGFVQTQLPAAMMAVMPEGFYGTTLSGHPTFFFYLPESHAQQGVFRLKNGAGEILYEQEIPNAHRAGVVALQLPLELPELAVGKDYHWYVALQFDEHLTPTSPFVSAMIRRVEPPAAVEQAAAMGTTLDYAAALAANGVWYDTIATLNALRVAQPTSPELAAHWQELLSSVDLAALAQSPLTIYAADLAAQ